MKIIETMNGQGFVTNNSGEKQAVAYALSVIQHERTISMLDGPSTTLPTTKEVRGTIKPVCFFGEDRLKLEMQDGKTLRFFFKDFDGRIAPGVQDQ